MRGWAVFVIGLSIALMVTAGCGDGDGDTTVTVDEAGLPNLDVGSEALVEGEPIPPTFTADGDNASPPLSWSGAPPETAGYAIVVDDPDAPTDEPFVHWVVYGLSVDVTSLPAGVETGEAPTALEGGVQGVNSFGNQGYDGPAPPRGDAPHRYRFTVYALAADPGLEPGLTKEEFLSRAADLIVAQGRLTALYERP